MKRNNNKLITYKISSLLLLILIFSFLYLLFDDTNFGGISNIQEIIKEELIKSKVQKEIKENKENFINNNLNNFSNDIYDEDIIKVSKKEEKAIDDTTKKIKNVVKDNELDVQVKPSFGRDISIDFIFR